MKSGLKTQRRVHAPGKTDVHLREVLKKRTVRTSAKVSSIKKLVDAAIRVWEIKNRGSG